MTDISKIIRRRMAPGILIFNMSHRLLFANKESMDLIPELRKAGKKTSSALLEIRKLCSEVQQCSAKQGVLDCNLLSAVLPSDIGPPYYMRAFPLTEAGNGKATKQIVILIEKVILKRQVNYEHVRADYSLTHRELEVLKLLCEGLANKELAEKLSISEYTVKDHIKKLMQKFKVSTRAEIISRLK